MSNRELTLSRGELKMSRRELELSRRELKISRRELKLSRRELKMSRRELKSQIWHPFTSLQSNGLIVVVNLSLSIAIKGTMKHNPYLHSSSLLTSLRLSPYRFEV